MRHRYVTTLELALIFCAEFDNIVDTGKFEMAEKSGTTHRYYTLPLALFCISLQVVVTASVSRPFCAWIYTHIKVYGVNTACMPS